MTKIDDVCEIVRKEGSGRRKSVHTKENVQLVQEMIFSQENQRETHSTQGEIAHERKITRNIDL